MDDARKKPATPATPAAAAADARAAREAADLAKAKADEASGLEREALDATDKAKDKAASMSTFGTTVDQAPEDVKEVKAYEAKVINAAVAIQALVFDATAASERAAKSAEAAKAKAAQAAGTGTADQEAKEAADAAAAADEAKNTAAVAETVDKSVASAKARVSHAVRTAEAAAEKARTAEQDRVIAVRQAEEAATIAERHAKTAADSAEKHAKEAAGHLADALRELDTIKVHTDKARELATGGGDLEEASHETKAGSRILAGAAAKVSAVTKAAGDAETASRTAANAMTDAKRHADISKSASAAQAAAEAEAATIRAEAAAVAAKVSADKADNLLFALSHMVQSVTKEVEEAIAAKTGGTSGEQNDEEEEEQEQDSDTPAGGQESKEATPPDHISDTASDDSLIDEKTPRQEAAAASVVVPESPPPTPRASPVPRRDADVSAVAPMASPPVIAAPAPVTPVSVPAAVAPIAAPASTFVIPAAPDTGSVLSESAKTLQHRLLVLYSMLSPDVGRRKQDSVEIYARIARDIAQWWDRRLKAMETEWNAVQNNVTLPDADPLTTTARFRRDPRPVDGRTIAHDLDDAKIELLQLDTDRFREGVYVQVLLAVAMGDAWFHAVMDSGSRLPLILSHKHNDYQAIFSLILRTLDRWTRKTRKSNARLNLTPMLVVAAASCVIAYRPDTDPSAMWWRSTLATAIETVIAPADAGASVKEPAYLVRMHAWYEGAVIAQTNDVPANLASVQAMVDNDHLWDSSAVDPVRILGKDVVPKYNVALAVRGVSAGLAATACKDLVTKAEESTVKPDWPKVPPQLKQIVSTALAIEFEDEQRHKVWVATDGETDIPDKAYVLNPGPEEKEILAGEFAIDTATLLINAPVDDDKGVAKRITVVPHDGVIGPDHKAFAKAIQRYLLDRTDGKSHEEAGGRLVSETILDRDNNAWVELGDELAQKARAPQPATDRKDEDAVISLANDYLAALEASRETAYLVSTSKATAARAKLPNLESALRKAVARLQGSAPTTTATAPAATGTPPSAAALATLKRELEAEKRKASELQIKLNTADSGQKQAKSALDQANNQLKEIKTKADAADKASREFEREYERKKKEYEDRIKQLQAQLATAATAAAAANPVTPGAPSVVSPRPGAALRAALTAAAAAATNLVTPGAPPVVSPRPGAALRAALTPGANAPSIPTPAGKARDNKRTTAELKKKKNKPPAAETIDLVDSDTHSKLPPAKMTTPSYASVISPATPAPTARAEPRIKLNGSTDMLFVFSKARMEDLGFQFHPCFAACVASRLQQPLQRAQLYPQFPCIPASAEWNGPSTVTATNDRRVVLFPCTRDISRGWFPRQFVDMIGVHISEDGQWNRDNLKTFIDDLVATHRAQNLGPVEIVFIPLVVDHGEITADSSAALVAAGADIKEMIDAEREAITKKDPEVHIRATQDVICCQFAPKASDPVAVDILGTEAIVDLAAFSHAIPLTGTTFECNGIEVSTRDVVAHASLGDILKAARETMQQIGDASGVSSALRHHGGIGASVCVTGAFTESVAGRPDPNRVLTSGSA
jgi:hypothetical protein